MQLVSLRCPFGEVPGFHTSPMYPKMLRAIATCLGLQYKFRTGRRSGWQSQR